MLWRIVKTRLNVMPVIVAMMIKNKEVYDQHLNMILGDVEEVVTTVEIDDETYEEIVCTSKRTIPFLFDRGDGEFLRPCGLCESSGGAFGNSTSTSFSLDKQAVGF